ncbi:MAG: hypothetical protein MJB14_08045 [Spirochaetes bacterium]|nr:hypothetical protein [Spirochaetota bacterium]
MFFFGIASVYVLVLLGILLFRLVKMYQTDDSKELQLALLEVFKNYQNKSIANMLVESLKTASSDLYIPIIETLAVCGTIDAVEHLYQFKKSHINPIASNAAQKAISQIQQGLKGAEAGRLSLSDREAEEGRLSLSVDLNSSAGNLSISENEKE